MRDDDARSPSAQRPWRDALLLVAVAVALVVGLVHYGTRLNDDDAREATSGGATSSASATPSDAAQLDSAPSGGASDVPPATPAGTCWDGRPTTRMSLCGLPEGTRGLRWIFPSLASAGHTCQRAAQPTTRYGTVVSWVCFERAAGQPVTITYDQVRDLKQATGWIQHAYADGWERDLPGAHGGRTVWFDASASPVRASGIYVAYPYVVSVWGPTPSSVKSAWAHLVSARTPREVLGQRA